MKPKYFETGLVTLDFSPEKVDESIKKACSLAASTGTLPAFALNAIHARVLEAKPKSDPAYPGNHGSIEETLVHFYRGFGRVPIQHWHHCNPKLGDFAALIAMSPVPCWDISPGDFLRAVYQPGDRVGLLRDGVDHSIWTRASADASIPIAGDTAVRFWPLPCNDNGPGGRSRDYVASWRFAVAKDWSSRAFAELINDGVPVVAIISSGTFGGEAIFRVNATSRMEWMAERQRLMTHFENHHIQISRHEKLVPLPGTIGKDGISRLVYFNPEAPAVP